MRVTARSAKMKRCYTQTALWLKERYTSKAFQIEKVTSKWNVAAVRMQHCSTSLKQRFISQWNNTACRGTIVVVPYGICQSMIFTWNSRVLLRILCYYHCTGQKWQLSAQPPELKYPHFWAEIQIFRITDFEGTQIFFRTHFTRLPHQRRRNTYRASCNTSKLPKLKSLFNCDM